jgi:hypothetical protein
MAGQVPSNYVIRQGEKAAVGTLAAFDPGLFADSSDPFIGARGCVARFAGLPAFESARVDVFTATKKRAEECDLCFWCL